MKMISEYFPFLMELNIITIALRTLLAFICAGVIGYDRNARGSAAGFRTHILVCLGAMIAMSTGIFTSLMYDADAERIGAQVVSGIGFLGAGTIIVNKGHIKGLTTAAGLWASACIGLAIGTGFYEGAIVGTVAVYITERVLHDFSKGIRRRHGAYNDTDETDQQTDEHDALPYTDDH